MKNALKHFGVAVTAGILSVLAVQSADALDLLQRYPTKLTGAVLEPGQARPWQFTRNDLFRVSSFHLTVGDSLKLEIGPADLGIGHCADGAVFAVVIPTESGTLKRQGGGPASEPVAHVWLRFHPAEINNLFPPGTVTTVTNDSVLNPMRTIAGAKFRSSYHAGMNAMIPEPKDLTVDVDTKGSARRFFMVDIQAHKAEYVPAFEKQAVHVVLPHASAPKIIMTKPADGAAEVQATLSEITVTFDQDMDEGCSWTGGGSEYPGSPEGARAEWRGKRTCVLPVALQPGHHYRVGINSLSYRNFRSVAGQPVAPCSISFTTK
jgi:hypothetical protein